MDIAELGLAIRSDGVVVAKNRLKDFEDQADRTERSADRMTKQVKRAEKAMGVLTKVLGMLAAAFSIQKMIEYTNIWTDLNSRVEIATGSIGQGAATMERLSDMARRTYSDLEQTTESFLRNSTAMRDLGYSTNQTLDYVEAMNNALVVSGAKGDRAESVMNALGKAMALGKLSGDNLNTVLASGGRITEALADSLGVTTLELRKLGADGKLTGDVIYRGLTSQLETLRAEADGMPATIGDAFTLLRNSILETVGTLDQATGASTAVADAIIWVADNAELLVPILGGLATVISVALIPNLVAATVSFGALTLAMLANPFVQLALLAGTLAAALIYLHQQQSNAAQAAATHEAALVNNANATEIAKTASQGFRDSLREQITMQIAAADAALKEAAAQIEAAKAKARAADIFGQVMNIGATALGMPGREVNYGDEIMAAHAAQMAAARGQLTALQDQLALFDEEMAANPPGAAVVHSMDSISASTVAANDNAVKLMETLKEEGETLTASMADPFERMAADLARLDELLAAGAISWETYGNAVARSNAQAAATTLGAVAGIADGLSQVFAQSKELSIAVAVLKGAESVASAFASGMAMGGPLFAWASAAAAGLTAAANVAAVMAVSPTSKSTSLSPRGSAPSVPNGAQRAPAEKTPDRTDVYLHGLDRNAMYSGENIERIIGLIEERSGDGRILNIKVA